MSTMDPKISTSLEVPMERPMRWWENVREKDRQLADKIVFECDWSWTESIPTLQVQQVHQYQLFILCKIVANDIQMKDGATRLILSPSEKVDEVWHEHLKRPVSYFQMCKLLLWKNETSDYASCLVDHTPNSEEDAEDVKEVRRQRTRDYMDLICPNWEKAFGTVASRYESFLIDQISKLDKDAEHKEVKRQRLSDVLHSMSSNFLKNTTFPAVKVTLLVYDSDHDLQLYSVLSIYPSESVFRVLSTFHSIPVTDQILVYHEKILAGNISTCEIKENDSLHLFMANISITIKALTGVILTIRANPSMSIHLLKQLIEVSKGFPTDSQRLILHGRILKDTEVVSEINYSTDSILVLIVVKR
jgi:hypothetical protein